jgi:hypothetical protein
MVVLLRRGVTVAPMAAPRLGRSILSLTYRWRAVEFVLDFLVISSA